MKKIQIIVKRSLLSVLVAVALFITIPRTAHMQAVYDCGTYGSGSYSENCPEEDGDEGPSGGGSTGGQQGGGSTSSGNLSSTGESIKRYGLLGGGFLILSIALFVAIKKNTKKST